MEQYSHIVSIVALSMGAAWASGINLYAAVLMLGVMGLTNSMELPPDLQLLAHPAVLAAAGFMYLMEFFADKTPGVDTGWDTLHTFIRIPAGAILAAGAAGAVDPSLSVAAGLVGGGVATISHTAKAGSRILINTSPEPFSNIITSLTEDVLVIGGLWAALTHPFVFLGFFLAFILAMVWLLPKLWHGVCRLFAILRGFFSKKTASTQKKPEHLSLPSGS